MLSGDVTGLENQASAAFDVGASLASAEVRSSIVAKVARRKLSLLEMATELDHVVRAYKVMGNSGQQSCEIRRNFHTYGAENLVVGIPDPCAPTHRTQLPR